ncbi:hypothetical protein ABLN67_12985 [Mycobacterium tuberculosis]
MFNRFIYRREWVFAFIVKRFRVFRAPLQRDRNVIHRSEVLMMIYI